MEIAKISRVTLKSSFIHEAFFLSHRFDEKLFKAESFFYVTSFCISAHGLLCHSLHRPVILFITIELIAPVSAVERKCTCPEFFLPFLAFRSTRGWQGQPHSLSLLVQQFPPSFAFAI
jgi:hypothetical protein